MQASSLKRKAPIKGASSFKQRVPMKRTQFGKPKPKEPSVLRPVVKHKNKPRPGIDQKALDACAGQPCYLTLPGIICAPVDTVVGAHRNQGKGMGMKVPDRLSLPACFHCHYEYDQGNKFTREQKRGFFDVGHAKWVLVRDANG